MKQRIELGLSTYGPMQHKTFEGALDSFFANEVPQVGGSRTRQLLVQLIQELVGRFYPQTSHLRQGQIQWTAVHKLEKASYGKRITQSRLTPVILDLVQSQDALDRAGGKKLREIKQDAVVRLFQQAYQQNGVLTNGDLAVLLKISPSTVSHYAREWEKANGRYLPRRGVIHDIGPTLTHKRQCSRSRAVCPLPRNHHDPRTDPDGRWRLSSLCPCNRENPKGAGEPWPESPPRRSPCGVHIPGIRVRQLQSSIRC